MDRLGFINKKGNGMCSPKKGNFKCEGDCNLCKLKKDAFKKLSQYEDIGLMPNEIEQELNSLYKYRDAGMLLTQIINTVHKIESGEFVEVVRCGDCKHRFINKKCLNSDSGYYEQERNSNNYCEYGEMEGAK